MSEQKPTKDRSKGPNWSRWFLPGVILLLALLFLQGILSGKSAIPLTYREFKEQLRADNVKVVRFGRSSLEGETKKDIQDVHGRKGTQFSVDTYGLPEDSALHAELTAKSVDYSGTGEPGPWGELLLWMLPTLLLLGLLYFVFSRQMNGPAGSLSFGRSRAKLYAQDDLNVTFDDVAGIDESVEELREVVDFLKNPEKYQAIGGRIPKGVLLVGPPGTGKTLLARAVAGEAGVPFFGLSGSDFVEMFVGVGAARVRDLFSQAEQRAPCIIFIDELDAMGKSRGSGFVGGHDEREQTLNQLLVEMDGFDSNRGVIIMAATNRPETLDSALLRPGRFDRTVVVDRPDVNGREAILKVHIRNIRVADGLNLREVASLTPGFVGADLANLVNEAALLAARHSSHHVTRHHMEEAIERGMAGLERKRRVMMPEEKRRIAYHECGHAIVAYLVPGSDPVHKISIVPRGIGALGYTLQRPIDDRYLATRTELESRIATLLGGTIAEEIVFQETSTGAQNDLERVADLARSMVKHFGMSEKLGRLNYRDTQESAFLGSAPVSREYSESTAREIDLEVRRIVDSAQSLVKDILVEHRAILESLAEKLLEKEVLDAGEFQEVMKTTTPRLVPGSAYAARSSSDPDPTTGLGPSSSSHDSELGG